MRGFRGFAIPFVLLVVLILSTLTTAAVYRYTQTTRFLQLGQETVRARALADSGLEMALVMMRDESIEWYNDPAFPYPVTSQSMGLTPADIGGEFQLFVESYPALYPSEGTFRTIRWVGQSGRAQATSLATVKLTSPLTNFLVVSNGNYILPGWADPEINGPIFVNANGDNGDFRIWHDNHHFRRIDKTEAHAEATVTMNAQIKAAGDIYVQNHDSLGGLDQAPLMLNGEIPPGEIIHDDLATRVPGGKIVLPTTLTADPAVELNVEILTTPEMLEIAR